MKLDLNIEFDRKRSESYFKTLLDKRCKIELKEVKKSRTIKQNAYTHVLFTLYAIHFGSTLDEAKTDLKRECHFMTYENNGKKYLKRTRDLDTRQMGEFIDWIRNYASQNGCYLPGSEEFLVNKFEIERTIDQHKQYL